MSALLLVSNYSELTQSVGTIEILLALEISLVSNYSELTQSVGVLDQLSIRAAEVSNYSELTQSVGPLPENSEGNNGEGFPIIPN